MTAGRNTSANAGIARRVFISYARADGEQFAHEELARNAREFWSLYLAQGSVVPTLSAAQQKEAR